MCASAGRRPLESPGCQLPPSSASPQRTWLLQGSHQDWRPHSFWRDPTPHSPAPEKAHPQHCAAAQNSLRASPLPSLEGTVRPCASLAGAKPTDPYTHELLETRWTPSALPTGSLASWGTGAHRSIRADRPRGVSTLRWGPISLEAEHGPDRTGLPHPGLREGPGFPRPCSFISGLISRTCLQHLPRRASAVSQEGPALGPACTLPFCCRQPLLAGRRGQAWQDVQGGDLRWSRERRTQGGSGSVPSLLSPPAAGGWSRTLAPGRALSSSFEGRLLARNKDKRGFLDSARGRGRAATPALEVGG
ncbi:uncharacterized protein [Vicugna pacos]|uniref:Uncharacterized protein n=1 Tax=Vicugna pacos TaxID=30538 RepID=A0ABM5CJR8_VICPA